MNTSIWSSLGNERGIFSKRLLVRVIRSQDCNLNENKNDSFAVVVMIGSPDSRILTLEIEVLSLNKPRMVVVNLGFISSTLSSFKVPIQSIYNKL